MRKLGRLLVVLVALPLLLAGVLALGLQLRPDDPWVARGRGVGERAAGVLAGFEPLGLPSDLPQKLGPALTHPALRYALGPLGLVLLMAALLPGRRRPAAREPDPDEALRALPKDPRALKKARKEASAQARLGNPVEAAEIYFRSGQLEQAAKLFVEAEAYERAAEIYHDQKKFLDSAELYRKAGRFDAAGTIFAEQGEHRRAGEAYLEAGNQSVAGEMFEKAGEHERAADCYAASGFPRHAAQAYVKCRRWEKAATCLEDVILEEGTSGAGSDARRGADLRKLVRMAGDLYQRAGRADRAMAVLEKGGCFAEAAEVALASGQQARAAALFLEARDAPRAAAVLRGLGDTENAARILAEHHRDRGEEAEAARYFEQAGELLAAGDLYRVMEQYGRAGECYERQGDPAQAAEMFQLAGERLRAAANYERAGAFAEAAECFALEGDAARQAELLARAGEHVRAGRLHREAGRDDDAIAVLQQVAAEHPEFAAASALLGEIFRERGMLSLAVKKLRQALGESQISRDNAEAFYTLATVYEANEQPAESVELYEKILAFDYQYRDVARRLEAARGQVGSQEAAERAAADASAPLSGSTAQGRYRIVGKLGRGGMGVVYKAEDTVLERVVAFKVLPESLKENPQALKNFLREAKSAARLNHPNIVTVFDAGEQDGIYYIAMEYVDGNTLKDIIKHKGRISAGGIVHVVAQICAGLSFAHDKRVVHRDVKTANVMWTRDRKTKIMDFGLAKVVEEVRNHTTVVSGTPYYMSPEQTLGRNVDHRTDIYSLGVTMFEMATATLPFREGNLPYHHVHTAPPDPREFNPDLPAAIAAVILRCLSKNPDERFQTARAVVEQLKSGLG